jgi:hypothetical protein
MQFQVYGPYWLSRLDNKLISRNKIDRDAFWEEVDGKVPGLSEACGCYVFRIAAGRGAKPWYVGMAERQSFRSECLQPHKINIFNEASVGRRGTPELLFLPQVTAKGNFRAPTTARRPAIQQLESMLIGMAISRNPDLLNIKGTKMVRELEVEGFLNTNRRARGGPAKVLRDTLGG